MTESLSPATPEERTAATFGDRSAPDFARAHRHSRKVRFIKRALPLLLGGTAVAIVAVAVFQQLNLKIDLPFEVGTLHLSGTRLTMETPKLSGFTDDGRGYWVNAVTASQDLTNPDILDLTNIDARMELANKGWAGVKSRTGSVDTKKQIIWLKDGVDLSTAAGYSGRLANAVVDAKEGSVATDNPVLLTYRNAKLVADRMTVTDRGSRAFFDGHVQLDFTMSDLTDRQKAPPPAAPAPQQSGSAAPSKPAPATTTVAGKPPAPAAAPPASTGAKR